MAASEIKAAGILLSLNSLTVSFLNKRSSIKESAQLPSISKGRSSDINLKSDETTWTTLKVYFKVF